MRTALGCLVLVAACAPCTRGLPATRRGLDLRVSRAVASTEPGETRDALLREILRDSIAPVSVDAVRLRLPAVQAYEGPIDDALADALTTNLLAWLDFAACARAHGHASGRLLDALEETRDLLARSERAREIERVRADVLRRANEHDAPPGAACAPSEEDEALAAGLAAIVELGGAGAVFTPGHPCVPPVPTVLGWVVARDAEPSRECGSGGLVLSSLGPACGEELAPSADAPCVDGWWIGFTYEACHHDSGGAVHVQRWAGGWRSRRSPLEWIE